MGNVRGDDIDVQQIDYIQNASLRKYYYVHLKGILFYH